MIVFSEPSDDHDNEDVVWIEKLDAAWIGAVADGQGGRPGGAKAARLACESIIPAAQNSSAGFPVDPSFGRALFATADRAISANSDAGLTTLIAFCVNDGHVYGASCGDSAAYLCHGRAYVSDLRIKILRSDRA